MAVRVYTRAPRDRSGPADSFITRSGAGYKVHSPATVNGLNGVFLIRNLTADPAIVTLPTEVVGPSVGPTEVPPGYIAEFDLISGAGGQYSYSVVMKVAKVGLVTAQGNSDPVIIIDPECP